MTHIPYMFPGDEIVTRDRWGEADSHPLAGITRMREEMMANSYSRPGRLIMSPRAFKTFMRHHIKSTRGKRAWRRWRGANKARLRRWRQDEC